MHGRRLVLITLLALLTAADAAGAHGLTTVITPPPSPPAEDSGFAINFSGDATPLGDTVAVEAKIRPAGGTPCAPVPGDDSGNRITPYNGLPVAGKFSVNGTY